MKCNVGGADRALRIALGLLVVGWGLWASNPWGALGLVPLATGLFGWCPVYLPFGLRTCRLDSPSSR